MNLTLETRKLSETPFFLPFSFSLSLFSFNETSGVDYIVRGISGATFTTVAGKSYPRLFAARLQPKLSCGGEEIDTTPVTTRNPCNVADSLGNSNA